MRSRLLTRFVCFFFILAIVSCGGGGGSTSPNPPANPGGPSTAGDFQLNVEFTNISAQQAGIAQSQTVQVTSIGSFRGTVNMTVSGTPSGVTVSSLNTLSLQNGINAGLVTFTALSNAAIGSSTITVTGTSGALSHTITFSLAVRQAAPFTLQISSPSVTLAPASSTSEQVSLTVSPGVSPQVGLNIPDPPANSQLSFGILQGFLTPDNPFSMAITAPILAAPIQNFPVTLTASDNNNNTSVATFLLNVTAHPPTTISSTRSTFFRTDRDPTGMVYDPSRKLLFVSVEILNEVVVLSTVDGHEVTSIPVGFPAGIDESTDGRAIYVASPIIPGVTTIDPDLLQVVGHSTVPSSVSGIATPITFFQLVTLSNGKVLFTPTFDVVDLLNPPFYMWDPATGTFSLFGPRNLSTSVGIISRNADHTKVLASQGISPTGFLYDVTTDTFNGPNSAITGFPAFRPASSQFASIQLQNSGSFLTFYDSNFNPLASIPMNELSLGGTARLIYSSDGRFLYVVPDQSIGSGFFNVFANVIDTSTFSIVGVVPAFQFGAILPFSGQWITTFDSDETGMVFGAAFGGVGFLDMTSPVFPTLPLPGPFSVQPELSSLSTPTVAQLSGVGFAQGLPLNLFIGPSQASPQTHTATNISVQNNNFLNVTIPPGITAGPTNATLTRSDGFFEVVPDAVTFGPTILQVDANAGSPSGGDKIQIAGYGLSTPGTQVTIGGRLASITQQGVLGSQQFPVELIKLTTPPGASGAADLTVSTRAGSSTIAGGFQYLNSVQVHPIVGALDALVYDQARKRLYITNEDHNRIEIYDTTTNTFLAPIGAGLEPTALTITPDGNLLAVINRGTNTVTTINLNTLSFTANFSLLTAADSGGFCQGVALNITPATGHRALVDIGCSAEEFNGVFHLINLDTGSLSCTGVAGCDASGTDINFGTGLAALASTPDGSKVFLATTTGGGSPLPIGLLDFSANTLTTGSFGDFSDAAINADATILAGNFGVFNGVNFQGIMAFEPYADSGSQSFHNVFGEKLNPSGSLLFYPQDSGVDIFDTHTGRLALHLTLPDPIPADTNGMALDETGTKIFLISNTGITVAQLFQSPLSLATVNPAHGPQGTTVTIRGSGFKNGATVKFNAVQAGATFIDSNTLQAIVPVNPVGPVRVSVKNPDGKQYSFDAAFTVD